MHNSSNVDASTNCTSSRTIVFNDDDFSNVYGALVIFMYVIPIVMVIGIISNSAFLFTVWRIPRMQTTFNIYLQNLAVADLMYITIPVTLTLCYFFSNSFKTTSCFAFTFALSSLQFASIGMITLVAIERYLAICKPVQHHSLKSKKRTRILVTSIWIGSVIFASLLTTLNSKSITLCLKWPNLDKYATFPTVWHTCIPVGEGLVWVVLPTIIYSSVFATGFLANVIAYGKIAYSLSKQGLGSTRGHLRQRERISSDIRIRNQILRTMIINSAVLFLTNAPSTIIFILKLCNSDQTEELWTSKQTFSTIEIGAKSMLLLNSVINSFIYGFSSSFYRQAFREAFRCASMNTDIDAQRPNIKRNFSKTKAGIDNAVNDTKC